MFESLINRWLSATVKLHKTLLNLADSMRLALINLEQACERNTILLATINKENKMWPSSILDLHAHWMFIPHNPRNNRRTKKKR